MATSRTCIYGNTQSNRAIHSLVGYAYANKLCPSIFSYRRGPVTTEQQRIMERNKLMKSTVLPSGESAFVGQILAFAAVRVLQGGE